MTMAAFTKRLHDVLNDWDDIGLSDYPIFDESYREQLNAKIIRHYEYYEIGHETVELFRHNLRARMFEIMPYYNKLYESERFNFDPLNNYDLRTVTDNVTNRRTNTKATESGTSLSETTSNARTVNSETPQNLLSPNGDYATAAADSATSGKTTSESSGETSGETNDDDKSHGSVDVSGVSGVSRSGLLMDYRASLLNIDLMVISELESLFMQVWNTNDSYFGRIW